MQSVDTAAVPTHAQLGYGRAVFRWLLILVALLVSAPAGAMPDATMACHDAAATAQVMPTEHHRAPDAAPVHACVGCTPLGDWLAPRVVAPIALPALEPVARIVPLTLAQVSPPLLRPPRLG